MASTTVWNPAAGVGSLKNSEKYLIDPDDFVGVLALSPCTVFKQGLFVEMSGLRLRALLTATKPAEPKRAVLHRSKRNVCLKACADGSINLAKALSSLRMPLCMVKIMTELSNASAPRGGMYRKRFEFTCYLGNVVSCTKCKSACLIDALLHFYKMDPKCVGEVMHLLIKAEDVYKPSNCVKMKAVNKLCPKAGTCKGKNPICNF
ncbi:late expression factor 2 [Anticarsia gemmatalis multiple nucleopolyhedrovirus]|uniref:Late expression factor 2 n=2 Tax=Alphabaculovirus TaxID=558016 RepID=LEF2_NPVAG|nr:late expression factor 2 [Anticarsia gemmatalis multiple nucleopolyhedrovirus]YP_803397.1 late expression factor 2 [Anticarsia gemmatalis nucleopolyhedrovirus]P81473.2 RecName: Full=Late expression factor 2 [Anticarsia gemmatalis nucleopolyhedrovirus]ABI13787.1 late expression factor 2 [Anticarsia gemmatalis multiple nucleopolyhedrovirus]ALR70594.1 late expression factor 2 [Anticarsia gemmatalis multiple nucleopolyhedrovirus]ALR71695.1 late expression factor 2 [Anticarsia gemmatalis multipl